MHNIPYSSVHVFEAYAVTTSRQWGDMRSTHERGENRSVTSASAAFKAVIISPFN
jgi:hypothetical protein